MCIKRKLDHPHEIQKWNFDSDQQKCYDKLVLIIIFIPHTGSC